MPAKLLERSPLNIFWTLLWGCEKNAVGKRASLECLVGLVSLEEDDNSFLHCFLTTLFVLSSEDVVPPLTLTKMSRNAFLGLCSCHRTGLIPPTEKLNVLSKAPACCHTSWGYSNPLPSVQSCCCSHPLVPRTAWAAVVKSDSCACYGQGHHSVGLFRTAARPHCWAPQAHI